MDLLRRINADLWHEGVSMDEFALALLGQVEDDRQMRKILADIERETKPLANSFLLKMEPFSVPTGDERTLLRVKGEGEDNIWIGMNLSTIQKVPFLEAFCSERWSRAGGIPEISAVEPASLRLVDIVFSSGRDFREFSPASLPMKGLPLNLTQLSNDLDFLNIVYKTPDMNDTDVTYLSWTIRDAREDRGDAKNAAESLVMGILSGKVSYHRMEHKEKNAVFDAILFIVSHPGMFGNNLRYNTEKVASTINFTVKQKDRIKKSKMMYGYSNNDRYDDFDTFCGYSDDDSDFETGYFNSDCYDSDW